MIFSMTAYASSEKKTSEATIVWEMRSVNHRYLDASYRLPEGYRALEPELRNMTRAHLQRGKLECQLKIIYDAKVEPLHINAALVQSILQAGESLSKTYDIPFDLSVSKLLSWPDIMQAEKSPEASLNTLVLEGFAEAVHKLKQVRQIEGEKLQGCLLTHLHDLNQEIMKAKTEAHISMGLTRDKLKTRLKAIGTDVLPERIEQEIALLISKIDVTEELERLIAHTQEFKRILDEELTHGKRLDFLVQELNREANTLSAKSDTVCLTKIAVEMKVLIEQMREQIQNIE